MSRLHLLLLVTLIGCGGSGHVGDACGSGKDCASKICLSAPFPGGYCTIDCSTDPCPAGELCSPVGAYLVCLKGCAAATDCRAGYQCFQGACQAPCGSDDDCGKGFMCQQGQCVMRPGAPVGAACAADSDCASQICLKQKCEQGCARDGDCAADQTCFVNPVGDAGRGLTTHVVPICVARRGTAPPGTACTQTADCDRGSCELGLCTEMCTTVGDCRMGTGCATLVEIVGNNSGPTFQGCLPTNTTLEIDGASDNIPLPSTAQSFAIYIHVDPFDFSNLAGVTLLTDPTKMSLYTQPQTEADYYAQPVRYLPTEGSSTMLVPNSPAVTLMPGLYRFVAATGTGAVPTSRVYLKLHDGPITQGSVPLNFYYTDLSGACSPLTFSQLQNGALSSAINEMKRIFQQANLTVSSVNFVDVSGSVPNTIKVDISMGGTMLPDLDNELAAATANRGTTPGLDIVLVRSITDPNGNQSGVLGVAGGIPANPVLGTAHSGAVVSIETYCFAGGPNAAGSMTTLASTMAHETSHTLGLFHNIEQDASLHDPLTDTASDGQNNLMYWLEDSGEHLSMQQGQVLRNDPKVQQ